MEFTTHNQQDIDTQDLSQSTTITATAKELTDLFGKGMLDKPMWRVLFKDESVALIYPADAERWYVESRNKQGLDNVQITLDLSREQTEEKRKKNPIEEALQGAVEIMDMLRATKGEKYAMLVELGMLVRKNQDLLHAMVGAAIAGGEVPEPAGDIMGHINAQISAKIIGIASRMGDVARGSANEAEELMGWVDRMLVAEGKGAKGLMESIMKEDK